MTVPSKASTKKSARKLRRSFPLDDLPYKIHTGQELALMLEGSKPLSYFSTKFPPASNIEEIPESLFDRYVEKGRFVKREYVMHANNSGPALGSRGLGMRIVMYALPHHEWRINAMLLLMNTAIKSGWNEGFERMQGSLLGYEDWQNDIFIERIYRPALERGNTLRLNEKARETTISTKSRNSRTSSSQTRAPK